MTTRATLFGTSAFRTLLLSLGTTMAIAAHAQVLFVNDNDNITYNTDTVLNGLQATTYTIDVFDIPAANGAVPTFEDLDANEAVIWYTSTDGVGLGFWDNAAQAAVLQYLLTGKPLWVVGSDLLYAIYPPPPYAMQNEDFAGAYMGVDTYQAQSYGDDGNMGCPQMDLEPGTAAELPELIEWIFPTAYWVDGCSLRDGAVPIYNMGPTSYALSGWTSMLRYQHEGMDVTSTFFDPALISTHADRVAFLQGTLDMLLQSGIGIAPTAATAPTLTIRGDASNGSITLVSDRPMSGYSVYSAEGRLISAQNFPNAQQRSVDTQAWRSGVYLVQGRTADGHLAVVRTVKQ